MDMSRQFYCLQRPPHLRISAIDIAGADDPLPLVGNPRDLDRTVPAGVRA
jgi:hypothetical protein